MIVVRTSFTAWSRHEDDHAQRQAGLDVLNHIVRQTRQARSVIDISLASDNSGTLTLLNSSGSSLVWDHDAGSKEVRFGVNTATNLLASSIEELTFIGYNADGVATTDVDLIHSVECVAKVIVARPSGSDTITTACRAWLRSW